MLPLVISWLLLLNTFPRSPVNVIAGPGFLVAAIIPNTSLQNSPSDVNGGSL